MPEFKPKQGRTPQDYERQIEGLQHLVARYKLQTHETFECECGQHHCHDDEDVIRCVTSVGSVGISHCRDANCAPCQQQAAEEYRQEQIADIERHG